MNYELQALIQRGSRTVVYEGFWNPFGGLRLRGWRLLIDAKVPLPTLNLTIGQRYVLTTKNSRIVFELTYLGLQKSGMGLPNRYGDVVPYLREKFATHGLPLIDEYLPANSVVLKLRQFADVSPSSSLEHDTAFILGRP